MEWYNINRKLKLDNYEITKIGKIRNKLTQYVLTASLSNGYLRICVKNSDSIRKSYSIHRLVAETFIENPLNKPTVDHINQNKLDNNIENLRWATISEQNKNQKRNTQNWRKPIIQIDKNGNEIQEWCSTKTAEIQLNISGICMALNGKTKTAGGFIWKYKIEVCIDGEIWKQAPLSDEFEKIFVSNLGRVKTGNSIPFYGTLHHSRYLNTHIHNKVNKKIISYKVHRLVAMTFLPVTEEFNTLVVNHLNGNSKDNRAINLQWCSHKENTRHALMNNLITTSKSVVKICKKTDEKTYYVSLGEAVRMNNLDSRNFNKYLTRDFSVYKYKGKNKMYIDYVWIVN